MNCRIASARHCVSRRVCVCFSAGTLAGSKWDTQARKLALDAFENSSGCLSECKDSGMLMRMP